MRTAFQQNITFTGTSKSGSFGSGGSVSRLYGFYIVYDGGAPGTTVVTLTNLGRTLLATPAGNTAKYFPLLENAVSSTGATIATGNPFVEAVISGDIAWAISSAATTTGTGYEIYAFLYDD